LEFRILQQQAGMSRVRAGKGGGGRQAGRRRMVWAGEGSRDRWAGREAAGDRWAGRPPARPTSAPRSSCSAAPPAARRARARSCPAGWAARWCSCRCAWSPRRGWSGGAAGSAAAAGPGCGGRRPGWQTRLTRSSAAAAGCPGCSGWWWGPRASHLRRSLTHHSRPAWHPSGGDGRAWAGLPRGHPTTTSTVVPCKRALCVAASSMARPPPPHAIMTTVPMLCPALNMPSPQQAHPQPVLPAPSCADEDPPGLLWTHLAGLQQQLMTVGVGRVHQPAPHRGLHGGGHLHRLRLPPGGGLVALAIALLARRGLVDRLAGHAAPPAACRWGNRAQGHRADLYRELLDGGDGVQAG
jgi:hypothetical protein